MKPNPTVPTVNGEMSDVILRRAHQLRVQIAVLIRRKQETFESQKLNLHIIGLQLPHSRYLHGNLVVYCGKPSWQMLLSTIRTFCTLCLHSLHISSLNAVQTAGRSTSGQRTNTTNVRDLRVSEHQLR
jgi:hypothetical protein